MVQSGNGSPWILLAEMIRQCKDVPIYTLRARKLLPIHLCRTAERLEIQRLHARPKCCGCLRASRFLVKFTQGASQFLQKQHAPYHQTCSRSSKNSHTCNLVKYVEKELLHAKLDPVQAHFAWRDVFTMAWRFGCSKFLHGVSAILRDKPFAVLFVAKASISPMCKLDRSPEPPCRRFLRQRYVHLAQSKV